MKNILISIGIVLALSGVAWACTTTTIIGKDGTLTICQTCCTSPGNCTVTCF